MEVITLKMDKEMIQRMDTLIKKNQYGTRTEFIRSALRDKMNFVEKEDLIKKILLFKGTSNTKTTDTELRKIKREAEQEYIKQKKHL